MKSFGNISDRIYDLVWQALEPLLADDANYDFQILEPETDELLNLVLFRDGVAIGKVELSWNMEILFSELN